MDPQHEAIRGRLHTPISSCSSLNACNQYQDLVLVTGMIALY